MPIAGDWLVVVVVVVPRVSPVFLDTCVVLRPSVFKGILSDADSSPSKLRDD